MDGRGREMYHNSTVRRSRRRDAFVTVLPHDRVQLAKAISGGFQLQLRHETKIRSFRRLTRSALAQTARIPSLHMTDTTPAH